MSRRLALVAACLAVVWGAHASAQPAPAPPQAARVVPAPVQSEPSAQTATLTFFNRPIVVLRARVLGRDPAERVASADRALNDLITTGFTGPIEARPFDGNALIAVATRGVVVLTPQDVDELSGETVTEAAARATARLQEAFDAAAAARAPGALLRASLAAGTALALGLLAMWGVSRARHAIVRRIVALSEATAARAGSAGLNLVHASRLPALERTIVAALAGVVELLVLYATVGFVLRLFPFTRPWGESMRGFLLMTAKNLGLGVANAVPGLVTVLIIFLLTRFIARLIGVWFRAVESGQATLPGIYPETAQPTRRLLTGLLWVFAVVVAYPYMPGSHTEAFKGVSVFVGLVISLGSSGLVNQVMSGFTITYSRALRRGDYVRVGDVEGTVMNLGALSTRLKTLQREEVTIPNAVVVSQVMTDYSRPGDAAGVLTPTSVTIGYDAPWRQVHALLLQAAERTPGLRREPKPFVIQAALEDFYVKYTLFVSLEHQESRLVTMDALHANVQDLFNEYGVQIMSPNYVLDPASPKVVAKQNWFAAPSEPGK